MRLRFGENQYRTLGGSGRNCGDHKNRTCDATPNDSGTGAFSVAESSYPSRWYSALYSHRELPMASARSAFCRDQFLWLRRNQRSRRAGTSARICTDDQRPESDGPKLLLISSATQAGLQANADRYASWMAAETTEEIAPLPEICATAALHRTHHDHRLAVVGESAEQIATRLKCGSGAKRSPGWPRVQSMAQPHPSSVCVFGARSAMVGHGPRTSGPGTGIPHRCRELRQGNAAACRMETARRVAADQDSSRLSQTEFAQPAIFALQVGLAASGIRGV